MLKVKVTQSCLTLCNPMDYTVCGILQARILEWVAFLFSRGSSGKPLFYVIILLFWNSTYSGTMPGTGIEHMTAE